MSLLDTSVGWSSCITPEFITATSAGSTSLVQLAVVPTGEIHWYIACSITHDDAAGSKDMYIVHEDASAKRVGLTTQIGITTDFNIALLRPVMVPAGERLAGVSRTAVAAGSDFVISGQFLRLSLGEYVPGSPYG